MRRRAFSMIEVMVSAVIFAMAATGVFATIAYVNRPAVVDSKYQAALFTKRILEDLDTKIYPNSPDFSIGTHNVDPNPDFVGYSAVYEVFDDLSGAKKVTVNVHWDPPANP